MRIIDNLKEGLPVFDALSNEIRIKILELLLERHQMNTVSYTHLTLPTKA